MREFLEDGSNNNNNNYNSNAFRRRQEERNRLYQQQQQAYQLAYFNAYLKSPEIMLYNAIIKEDIDAISEIMTTHRDLTPDSYILYLDKKQELTVKAGRVPTSLLKLAFGKKKLRVISFLIEKGANFQEPLYFEGPFEPTYPTTTLIEALNGGYTDIINQILSKNPSPAFINANGNNTTALISAVGEGDITYVKQIVQAGANINQPARFQDFLTPLYQALVLKFYEIADFLKQNGATRPSMKNMGNGLGKNRGKFILDLESLNWILKNYLSDFGLPSNTYDSETNPENILFKIANLKNKNLLHGEFLSTAGTYSGYEERVALLRPLFNNIDSSGNTALMVAIAANNITLATDLINFGAKTSIQNNEGNTALHFAALNAKGKTGDERTAAIALINKLIDKNQALTKIKNKAGYGPGNPKLTMNAEITKLIHGRKPWLTAKNTNKAAKVGGANTCKRSAYGFKASRVARSPFKTLKAAKKAEAAAKAKKPIGFTATSSLKAMGRMARSNGCYTLGPKYE